MEASQAALEAGRIPPHYHGISLLLFSAFLLLLLLAPGHVLHTRPPFIPSHCPRVLFPLGSSLMEPWSEPWLLWSGEPPPAPCLEP